MTDLDHTLRSLDGELFEGHRPTDGMMQARKERRRLMIGAGLVVALVAICALSPARATPWTDENGNPNPECLSTHCRETGVKDAPPAIIGVDVPHRDPAPLHGLPEVHKGFDCFYAPWGAWVYHAAARLNMTTEHDAAAMGEALHRLDRLGDEVAMTKVCRKWQINAGFKIAKVL